jgi:uncharacterized protein YwqG
MGFFDRLFGKKEDLPLPQSPMNDEHIARYREIFKTIEKPAIYLEFDKRFKKKSCVGTSKIGGNPDLPPDFEWFYYEGEHFDGSGTANRPLSFIAQINCAEANEYEIPGLLPKSLLPESGMLYFFYDMASSKWGFDPQDKGCARVFYYGGDLSELQRTELPDDLSSEPYNFRIPEKLIYFSANVEIPYFDEFLQLCDEDLDYSDDAGGDFQDIKAELGYEDDEDDNIGKSKLLGYADLVQGEMLSECERVTNGINCGDGRPQITEADRQNCKQWQLLFQLGSFNIDDYELMWGDMGRIYYYIKTDDLKKLNFDNCWLILQCG